MATLFNLIKAGPPPGTATTPAEQWIDLGLITTGSDIFIGSCTYSAPNKAITFELRTNLSTKSLGTIAETSIIYSTNITPKNGTKTIDLYNKGLYHRATVIGTGVEHWWLRLVAKSATAGSYSYKYNYVLE